MNIPKVVTYEKVLTNRVNELENKLKTSFVENIPFSMLDACLLSHYRYKLGEQQRKLKYDNSTSCTLK
jgi:hypothetical protein